jgi:hypothetical protein
MRPPRAVFFPAEGLEVLRRLVPAPGRRAEEPDADGRVDGQQDEAVLAAQARHLAQVADAVDDRAAVAADFLDRPAG